MVFFYIRRLNGKNGFLHDFLIFSGDRFIIVSPPDLLISKQIDRFILHVICREYKEFISTGLRKCLMLLEQYPETAL